MAGSFDFLHIKRRTEGSSNELSFDVLEHMSDESAGKSSRRAKEPKALKTPKAPKAPKAAKTSTTASLHATTGRETAASLPSQGEVEKRKKARQAHRVRLYAFVAVAVVVLVAVGVYAGLRFQEDQADVTSHVNELVERLSAVDESLVEIDGMMADPLNADEAEQRAKYLAGMPKLTTELNRISVDAQSLLSLPIDEQAALAVEQINSAAQTRNGMLVAASEAFNLSSESSAQVARANSVWNDVLKADQHVREAISDSNKATTQEATNEALEAIRSAIDEFSEALWELQDISGTYGVDFADQEAYLTKKIEALQLAAATDEALLAGNRAAATTANDAYAEADAEAVRLAAELPPSIGDIVQEGFTKNMASIEERYQEARERTVVADSVIRDYLG